MDKFIFIDDFVKIFGFRGITDYTTKITLRDLEKDVRLMDKVNQKMDTIRKLFKASDLGLARKDYCVDTHLLALSLLKKILALSDVPFEIVHTKKSNLVRLKRPNTTLVEYINHQMNDINGHAAFLGVSVCAGAGAGAGAGASAGASAGTGEIVLRDFVASLGQSVQLYESSSSSTPSKDGSGTSAIMYLVSHPGTKLVYVDVKLEIPVVEMRLTEDGRDVVLTADLPRYGDLGYGFKAMLVKGMGVESSAAAHINVVMKDVVVKKVVLSCGGYVFAAGESCDGEGIVTENDPYPFTSPIDAGAIRLSIHVDAGHLESVKEAMLVVSYMCGFLDSAPRQKLGNCSRLVCTGGGGDTTCEFIRPTKEIRAPMRSTDTDIVYRTFLNGTMRWNVPREYGVVEIRGIKGRTGAVERDLGGELSIKTNGFNRGGVEAARRPAQEVTVLYPGLSLYSEIFIEYKPLYAVRDDEMIQIDFVFRDALPVVDKQQVFEADGVRYLNDMVNIGAAFNC